MALPLGRYLSVRPEILLRILVGMMLSILVGGLQMQQQMANATDDDHSTMTYVLLLDPKCDYEFRDDFESYLRANNTGYEQYIGDYYVICMGGVTDLRQVEAYLAPQLRYHLPYDTFLFVYPDTMNEQYYDYMENKYGYQYRYSALGNADILTGTGYAKAAPFYVKHEMAHLGTCGTWHDAEGRDIDSIIRHPEADQLAWCA
jgi:hypothetical protein